MFEKIVVPLDGTNLSKASLPYATEMARKFKASLLLIQVVAPTAVVASGVEGPSAVRLMVETAQLADMKNIEDARTYLDGVAVAVKGPGLKVETFAALGGPAEQVLKLCRDKGAGLVVMTTHGRTGLRRTMLGSVADEIVRSSLVPVLVIRPEEKKPVKKK